MSSPELPVAYVDHLQRVSTNMVLASSEIVLAGQDDRDGLDRLDVVVKADKSLRSNVDQASEAAAKAVWYAATPHPILGEEAGVSSGATGKQDERAGYDQIQPAVPAGRILGMSDPIDGSRPFINGAHTSTVMGGAYDTYTSRFVASSIVHPTSGTLVEASNGRTYVSRLTPADWGTGEEAFDITNRRQTSTWDGPMEGSTVLVDNFAPFRRGEGDEERVITNRVRLLRFHGELLDTGAVPQCYGSNGYHQLLLAKGAEKLAGAIMLSQGGPWDVLGLPAVENAASNQGDGRIAYAFRVHRSGRLTEEDPHKPLEWDVLALGSTAMNARILAGVVERTFWLGS